MVERKTVSLLLSKEAASHLLDKFDQMERAMSWSDEWKLDPSQEELLRELRRALEPRSGVGNET